MTTLSESIIIQCPICALSHTYQLEVDRSLVANYQMEDPDAGSDEKRFTRLFTCPDKKTRFQAEIALLEASGMKIRDVRIRGN
jgi:hypothetical protein